MGQWCQVRRALVSLLAITHPMPEGVIWWYNDLYRTTNILLIRPGPVFQVQSPHIFFRLLHGSMTWSPKRSVSRKTLNAFLSGL